jgi:hypothetical protein
VTVTTLGRPFAATSQPPDVVDSIRDHAHGFIVRHDLFVARDAYARTVTDFIRFCTPSCTSDAGLEAACMYAALVLFLDDDPGRADIVEPSVAFVTGIGPADAAHPAVQEIVAVVRRLASARALPPDRFFRRMAAMMRGQQREHGRTLVRPDAAEYLHWRPETIGSRGLIALMELDAGIDVTRLDPLARARGRLLEELSNRLVYLSNDILSSHREQTETTALSIVRLLAEVHRFSWADAEVAARGVYERDLEAYVHVRDDLRASPGGPTIERLVEITDAAAAGHLAAMECIRSRYRSERS